MSSYTQQGSVAPFANQVTSAPRPCAPSEWLQPSARNDWLARAARRAPRSLLRRTAAFGVQTAATTPALCSTLTDAAGCPLLAPAQSYGMGSMVPSYSAMPIPGTYAVAKPDAFGTARPMSPRFANTGLIQMPRSPVMEPLELVPMEPAVEKVAKQPIVFML